MSFDDYAALRYIIEHVRTAVQNEAGGMPITHVGRLLAQLPPGTIGRFQPTVETIHLAVQKFPGIVSIHPDGSVHSCVKTTSRTLPAASNAARQPITVLLNTESSDKITAEGRITAVKGGTYGFILTSRPPDYNVFYHMSAVSGWPAGSGGPKVGDPVELEFKSSSPRHKCRYIANVVRYVGSTPAEMKEPRRPDDKRVISDQVGVITFIRPDYGTIKFGDKDGETAFFDKKSMPKQLLRRGETLMDVFSVGEKVCFEAQPNLKGDGLGEWYATAVSTVQRGGGSVVFNDGDFVCYKGPNDQRTDNLEPPKTSSASQQTQSGYWDGEEHAMSTVQHGGGSVVFNGGVLACYKDAIDQQTENLEPPKTGAASQQTHSGYWHGEERALTDKQHQSQTAPQELSFEVEPILSAQRRQQLVEPAAGIRLSAAPPSKALPDRAGSTAMAQRPKNRNVSALDSSTGRAQDRQTYEAQLLERLSQITLEASTSSQERPGTSSTATGGGDTHIDCGFTMETAHQLATLIESSLLEVFKEELALVLCEELGLTAEDPPMLNEELKRH